MGEGDGQPSQCPLRAEWRLGSWWFISDGLRPDSWPRFPQPLVEHRPTEEVTQHSMARGRGRGFSKRIDWEAGFTHAGA